MNKSRASALWTIIALSLVLVGCSLFGLQRPKVVNHAPPNLAVDMTAFRDAGCAPGAYGWTCAEDSPVAAVDCDWVGEPSARLGGLDPAYPLMRCDIYPYTGKHAGDPDSVAQIEAGGYFYNDGCMSPAYVRYIAAHDGEFQVLATVADLQALFAPITSADEALSYALAATDYSAYYGLTVEPGYDYFEKTLEDTHVTEADDGTYTVHLFAYQFCGCGPHVTSSVAVRVSGDGQITKGAFAPAFKDPAEDGLCVD